MVFQELQSPDLPGFLEDKEVSIDGSFQFLHRDGKGKETQSFSEDWRPFLWHFLRFLKWVFGTDQGKR